MLYLVTGGAGFVGSHIVKRLVEQGDKVRALDNLSSGKKENLQDCLGHIEFIHGDINGQHDDIYKNVDLILHQAAIASVDRSIKDPVETEMHNVIGTVNVLKSAVKAGVKRVVIVSSAAVYGDSETVPLKEEYAVNPLSPYAISKYVCELYAKNYWQLHRLETVCLRYFNVFGPNQDPHSDYSGVISKFIDLMAGGKRPVIFGDGKQTRDFVFVDNIVEANLLAAGSDKVGKGEVINVGSGAGISINELVSFMNQVAGTTYDPLYRAAKPGDVRHSCADISLAQSLLGYRVKVGFREGLERLLQNTSTLIK